MASQTVTLQGLLIAMMIGALEERDVMVSDAPNTCIQAESQKTDGEDRVIVKMTQASVDVLAEMNPTSHGEHVMQENGKKAIHAKALHAICGMLIAASLWHKKFCKDLKEQGFVFEPHDPCIANKIVNRKQHMVRLHVEELLSSHKDKKVNCDFKRWLNESVESLVKCLRQEERFMIVLESNLSSMGKEFTWT